MPSFIERRKKIDNLDYQISKLTNTPENNDLRDTLNRQMDLLLEPPKWWSALLLPQEEYEKNTRFVNLNCFKSIPNPFIKVIIKLTNRRHSDSISCCSITKSMPLKRFILAAALPLTQCDGLPWDFEKYDEFIPRWRDCGGNCGCCGLFDTIKLLQWKTYNLK